MAQSKLLLDTNIVVDFLSRREPFYEKVRLLMILGRLGEFDLWVTSSQMTDLVYVLSEGGKAALMPSALERLRGLRTFADVHPTSAAEIDRMLSSRWKDPEDALLFEAALVLRADAIVTRNQEDFESSLIPALDCPQLFAWLEEERGLVYAEVEA